MERWVLEGDSYSFLRRAPQAFNLQSRDGPNHVEIFDITAIPSRHNAISETTCLCDIFGDDTDSPSLSSSPASASFLRRDINQPPVDDANDSSGSYHTASGSDSSDITEVILSTPPPKHPIKFSTPENCESPAAESGILSDSKTLTDNLPQTSEEQKDELLYGNNLENPEILTRPLTMQIEEEAVDSCLASVASSIKPADDVSCTTGISLMERDTADPEQEKSLDSWPVFGESEDMSIYSETCPQMDLTQSDCALNNLALSKFGERTSLEEISRSSDNSESPDLIPNTVLQSYGSVSPVTHLNAGINLINAQSVLASPEMMKLCSTEVLNVPQTHDFPNLDSCNPEGYSLASDHTETLSLTSSSSSADPRSLSIEENQSPEIHGTTSSLNEVKTPSGTPSSSHSAMIKRDVYSAEPQTSPEVTETEYSDTCSMSDHLKSSFSPLVYNISPYPTVEREMYSTEPEASSPIVIKIDDNDTCSSPDQYVSAHSPESAVSQSLRGCVISPSPVNEKMEIDDLRSSPYTVASTCSQDLIPELRSITSTPNSRENFLTPEPTFLISSPVRSVSCSPEIKTISYRVLSAETGSNLSRDVSYNNVSLEEGKTTCEYSSETPNSLFGNDSRGSPISGTFLSTSRPSSTASFPESSNFEKEENVPMNSKISPSATLCGFQELAQTDICRSSSAEQNKCLVGENLIKSSSKPTVSVEKNLETGETTNLNIREKDTSGSSVMLECETSHHHVDVYDGNSETEMLKKVSECKDERIRDETVVLVESVGFACKKSNTEYDRQTSWEMSGKREGRRHALGGGEETMGGSNNRGEQVELSFSARNSKGPGGHSQAPSSRDPKSGIPVRCYFESHPTALQQHGQLGALGSQQENKGGGWRGQSTVQRKNNRPGFLPPESSGETSSMGSEFDEVDNEVKWLTDLSFRSLSSPDVDYLDVYNSSHRSSTNVSQPSTVDSPGAVAWMSYADLRGSELNENDGSSFLTCDGLDPNKRFEMGSFECVDVALESKEEYSRGKRTVPKRQIQLLRRNAEQAKTKGSVEKVLNSPPAQRCSKDAIVRQHSTPTFAREEISAGNPESLHNDRKRMLPKSASLDDAPPNTQMASCIIKNVLSKKLQDAQKESSRCVDSSDDKSSNISPSFFDEVEKQSSISSQQLECTLPSDNLTVREERKSKCQLKKCAPKVPPKPFFRPPFFNTGDAELACRLRGKETSPTAFFAPQEDKGLRKQNARKELISDNIENNNSVSANANVRNTDSVICSPEVGIQRTVNRRDLKTIEIQEQLCGKSVFMSKTPEITLKPSAATDKKSSMKISVPPEQSTELSESIENTEEEISTRSVDVTDTDEETESCRKTVVHKVRDVRKLVKNTYNLSFKTPISTTEDLQEKREQPPKTPPALHIKCKAINRKDKQASSSEAIHQNGETQAVNTSKISQPQVGVETRRDSDITEMTSTASLPKTMFQQKPPVSQCVQPPRPPKEREDSTLCQDQSPKLVSKAFSKDSSRVKSPSNSHSVSMLLKEKGMQADIGVCDVLTETAIAKHVNRLVVPLQACSSDADHSAFPKALERSPLDHANGQESRKLAATLSEISTTTDNPDMGYCSGGVRNHLNPPSASKEIELPIQVRSVSTERLKSFVPPKPSYKQSSILSDPSHQTPQTVSVLKQQGKLSSDLPEDQTWNSSSNPKGLSVSAVSSYKPPPNPVATTPRALRKSVTLASVPQQQTPAMVRNTRDPLMEPCGDGQSTSRTGSQAHSHTRAANNSFRSEDYRFYASDDPPSYDDRERFSPLHPSDLPQQSHCRYHPNTKQSPLSEYPKHASQDPVLAAPQSPVHMSPAVPPQAQVRPHQCRPDVQQVVSSTTVPHASALIQPLHNPRNFPAPNTQVCGTDQPSAPGLQVDRRSANHHSPQALDPARFHGFPHSGSMSSLDTRPQMFSHSDLPSVFGHEYGNDVPSGASVIYPENANSLGCGQGPRRVLLDPETGKYFYVEVPMQPLRKMLFDPELGQYVEVLIPQQAMPHSGLYSPAAPPYSSLQNPPLYAPQYMPYALPSYPAIPGGSQQNRHPEPPPVPTTIHQSPLRYGSPANQMPKSEPKGPTSINQSYLENMYYVHTGLNASPNSTVSECYPKPSSNIPPSGRRV